MNNLKLTLFILLALFFQGIASAQESNYRRIQVDNRVSLEIPSHWHIRDIDERRNIFASGEVIAVAQGYTGPIYVSALSVVSKPEPAGAIIRVSFVPIEDFSQSDVLQALQSGRADTMREMAAAFHAEILALSKGLESQGMKILGQESVGTDSIGGATAFTLSYRRTSTSGQSPFTVTQYHIPIGKQKVLITLSYRESEALLFRPILDRVKRSVIIQ